MTPLSDYRLGELFSGIDSGREGLLHLFEEHRNHHAGSRLAVEFGSSYANSGFSHEALVQCLLNALIIGEQSDCLDIVSTMCRNQVPFMMVAHEIAFLRDTLIKRALDASKIEEIGAVIRFFDNLESVLARTYLYNFLQLLSDRLHTRLRHISTLSEKNLLVHFEKHLQWMQRLTVAVSSRQAQLLPEIHHDQCEFGQWLHSEGAALIRDKSHYKALLTMHAAMHEVSGEIRQVLDDDNVHLPLYALMKKAENYSLELGNEIALLNSMVVMSIYNKDPLTGTLTRRTLDRIMLNQLEISALTASPFCIVVCDIDHFKRINDSYGHVVGDQFIVHFARYLMERLRQSDLLFRLGGDEFFIILPATAYEQGVRIAEKLCADLSHQPLAIDAISDTIQASFGIMEVNGNTVAVIDDELVRELIQACDQRLYKAKKHGRNRVM